MSYCKHLLGLCFLVGLFSCSSPKVMSSYTAHQLLWTAQWSADGRYLATGGNQDSLRIFSGEDWQHQQVIPISHTITQLAWHPSKAVLAIARQGESAAPFLFDVEYDTLLPIDSAEAGGARAIGWNADGSLLAVGDNNGILSIYDQDLQRLTQVQADPKSVTGLDWHPSKDIVVTVGSQVSIYALNKDSLTTLQPREREVLMLCVDWHPSGDFFVTGDYGDLDYGIPPLLQFRKADGALMRELESSSAEYRSLVWNARGDRLAAASDALRIWSVDGRLLHSGKTPEWLWGLDEKDGQWLSSSERGRLTIWNAQAKQIRELTY